MSDNELPRVTDATKTGESVHLADMLTKQIHTAFVSGAIYAREGEYLTASLTIRAETGDDIKRLFSVDIELRDE